MVIDSINKCNYQAARQSSLTVTLLINLIFINNKTYKTMNEDLKTQPNVKQAVPFFMVTSLETSIECYVTGIGFEIKNSWIDKGKIHWCWLEIGGAALMLQEFGTEGKHTNVPKEKLGEGIVIFFICEDSLAIYRQVTARGLSTSEPFVGNNMWIVELRDPDGYKISFESPTDIPEETIYSDWTKRN